METWRCPTCLTLLVETGAKRCPSCHSKLRRRRSQPIVLGESSRLDMQAALAVDRRNKQRGEYKLAATVPAPPVIDLTEPEPELVAIVVDIHEPAFVAVVEETFVAAPLVAAPVEETFEAEPVEAILEDDLEIEALLDDVEPEVELEPVVVADAIAAFTLPLPVPASPVTTPEPVLTLVESEIAPEPAPIIAAAPSFLDLALAEHATAARAEPQADLGDALDGDVNSIVDALHRKARGQAVESTEPAQIPLFDKPVDHQPARPLRLTASSAGNRRRWSRRDG